MDICVLMKETTTTKPYPTKWGRLRTSSYERKFKCVISNLENEGKKTVNHVR